MSFSGPSGKESETKEDGELKDLIQKCSSEFLEEYGPTSVFQFETFYQKTHPFFEAALGGDIETLGRLIEEGFDCSSLVRDFCEENVLSLPDDLEGVYWRYRMKFCDDPCWTGLFFCWFFKKKKKSVKLEKTNFLLTYFEKDSTMLHYQER